MTQESAGGQVERMRALIDQALAELRRQGETARLGGLRLLAYGETDPNELQSLYTEAAAGTPAEGVPITIEQAGSRYICWNCCGLRFDSHDGTCPNCGGAAFEIPSEIRFSLRKVDVEV